MSQGRRRRQTLRRSTRTTIRRQTRLIVACLGLSALLLMGCNSKTRALKCISGTTSSLFDEERYQSLLRALNDRIAIGLADSSDVIEHVSGRNVLMNDARTKAIATELLIYNKPDGSRHGYGTVYLATLNEDSGWVFERGNAPNFFLSIRDVQVRDLLDSKRLEEHILGRFVDDGLMNGDGCTLDQDYIEHRWVKP